MRKTSQDGGDSSSITSGLENDIKRPITGIMKSKRNSIKRKVQNFSHESDDAVIEPLLLRDKEKTDVENQSAKNLMSKIKTDCTSSNKGNDTDKLLADKKVEEASITNIPTTLSTSLIANSIRDTQTSKSYASTTALMHNHMNTNVFCSQNGTQGGIAPKSQILVEIEGSKQSSYNPSSLVFTTAKIHADGKSMHTQQVTPVPILSTVVGSVVKAGNPTGSDQNIIGFIKDKNSSNDYATSATNYLNVTDKNQISTECNPVVNNTPTIGVADINIITVTSSNNNKTESIQKAALINSGPPSFLSQKLTSVNIGTSKVISCIDSTKDIKIESAVKASDNQFKNDQLDNTLLDQNTQISTSVTSNIIDLDKGFKSKTEDISKKNITSAYITKNDKIVAVISKECNMDINKNMENSSQEPGTSKDIKTLVNNESVGGVLDKNNKIITTTNNTSNKQIQRPKNTIAKDLKGSNQNQKATDAGQCIANSPSKSSNDSNDKLISSAKDQVKKLDSDISKSLKYTNIVPKSNDNSITVSKTAVTTIIASTKTAQSIISKPSVLTSATAVQPETSKTPLLSSTPTIQSVTIKASVLGSTPTIQSITKKASLRGSTPTIQPVSSKTTVLTSTTTVQPVTCKATVLGSTTIKSSVPYSTAQLPNSKTSVLSSTSSAISSTPTIKPLVSTVMSTKISKLESKSPITTVQVMSNQSPALSSVPKVKVSVSNVNSANKTKLESKPSNNGPTQTFKKSSTVSTVKPTTSVTPSISKPISSTKSIPNNSKSQSTSNSKPISGSVPSIAASKIASVTTMKTSVTTASTQLSTTEQPPINSDSVDTATIEVTAVCAPKTTSNSQCTPSATSSKKIATTNKQTVLKTK